VMTGSDFATTVRVTVTVTPALAGPNLYRARITGFDDDRPVPADAVTMLLRSITRPNLPAATIEFRRDADDWVAQALDPSVAGTYRISTQIRTGADVAEVPLTLITRSRGAITSAPSPGGDIVAIATFDDAVRLQASASAGTPTQVHITAFAANGTELALADLTLVASPATGEPERLTVQRFGAGHVAATATLAPGPWTLDAVATTRDGRAYQCTWQVAVSPV